MKVDVVIGTRPQYVKLAALDNLLRQKFAVTVIDTNQHYDDALSNQFLRDLKIPSPEINLRIGSGGHGEITGKILIGLEKIWLSNMPDLVIVVGDTNSCLGGALAAAKLGIPIAHVEAGLRSFEKTLPEEINRILTDHLSNLLFITEILARKNLILEGIPDENIYHVGNVMIDSLKRNLKIIKSRKIWKKYNLVPRKYGILTLHRPANVDSAEKLSNILQAVSVGVGSLPLIFPAHLRTKKNLDGLKYLPPEVRITEPLGYLDFIGLLNDSKIIITDSGGIQEESTVLGIPCVTLREVTERPITVEKGTNILAGTSSEKIKSAIQLAINKPVKPGRIPLWDGKAANRVVSALVAWEKKTYKNHA